LFSLPFDEWRVPTAADDDDNLAVGKRNRGTEKNESVKPSGVLLAVYWKDSHDLASQCPVGF
jgi:hypothetical protein